MYRKFIYKFHSCILTMFFQQLAQKIFRRGIMLKIKLSWCMNLKQTAKQHEFQLFDGGSTYSDSCIFQALQTTLQNEVAQQIFLYNTTFLNGDYFTIPLIQLHAEQELQMNSCCYRKGINHETTLKTPKITYSFWTLSTLENTHCWISVYSLLKAWLLHYCLHTWP